MSKPWLLVVAVVVCAAVGSAYFMLGPQHAAEAANSEEHESAPQRAAAAIEVEALHPVVGGLQRTTTQPGSVIPDKSADLFAKVSGYLSEETVDIGDRVFSYQSLVQGLQGEFSRAAALRFAGSLASSGGGQAAADLPRRTLRGCCCVGIGHCNSAIRFAISTATRAASRPFSTCRACACATFSVVRMALTTGNW